ncbi:hypothetical protein [Salirhabdus salicampi]|uniref:hypothetical protein n=1 Tax=Salirhabdus salicampi TaxID=476102 RepID=UPI0020C22E2A|nr:hypothetical protein [Salirhabdus salicampi]MCP8617954.1 hypothetical protein [Salirhabdus salicampi]
MYGCIILEHNQITNNTKKQMLETVLSNGKHSVVQQGEEYKYVRIETLDGNTVLAVKSCKSKEELMTVAHQFESSFLTTACGFGEEEGEAKRKALQSLISKKGND